MNNYAFRRDDLVTYLIKVVLSVFPATFTVAVSTAVPGFRTGLTFEPPKVGTVGDHGYIDVWGSRCKLVALEPSKR